MAAYQGQGQFSDVGFFHTRHRIDLRKKNDGSTGEHSSKDGRVPTSETDGSIEMIHSIIFEVKNWDVASGKSR